GVNVPVREVDVIKDNPYSSRIPFLSTAYTEVLYPATEAEDRKQGKKFEYFLAPPDPWLVALGMVMCQGIVQGMTWDMVKVLVNAALIKLRREGVAPPSENHQVTKKESVELGFCWVKYSGGKKLKEMFFYLRKHNESKSRPVPKPKTTRRRK